MPKGQVWEKWVGISQTFLTPPARAEEEKEEQRVGARIEGKFQGSGVRATRRSRRHNQLLQTSPWRIANARSRIARGPFDGNRLGSKLGQMAGFFSTPSRLTVPANPPAQLETLIKSGTEQQHPPNVQGALCLRRVDGKRMDHAGAGFNSSKPLTIIKASQLCFGRIGSAKQ